MLISFSCSVLKGGKVVYSEIVTNFKSALSNPETLGNKQPNFSFPFLNVSFICVSPLAEARNQFKDHVNTLATVTNENVNVHTHWRVMIHFNTLLVCFLFFSVYTGHQIPGTSTKVHEEADRHYD